MVNERGDSVARGLLRLEALAVALLEVLDSRVKRTVVAMEKEAAVIGRNPAVVGGGCALEAWRG